MTGKLGSSSLHALQDRFQAHVLQSDAAALNDICDGTGWQPSHRLGVYHHAYRARLLETMRDTFSHTWRYLGDEWFDQLALPYIEQHPSRLSNLRWYGETWPSWLAGDRLATLNLGNHPEVAELAQLDWALRRSFDAADSPALTAAHLSALLPDQWVNAALVPQAGAALLSVACNTLALWHALDQDEEVPPAEQLAQALSVLVWRQGEQPHFRSLADEEAHALTQVMLGHSFADVCDLLARLRPDAVEQVPAMAGAMLRRWLSDGVLACSDSMVASQSAPLALAENQSAA